MTNTDRTRKIPGSYTDEEIARIEADAQRLGLKPPAYIRKRLKLPRVERGRPSRKPNGNNGLTKHVK